MSDVTIRWREAAPTDVRDIWTWRNDAEARRASFDTGRIGWRAHQAWFAAVLDDPDRQIWVAESTDGRPLGQLRLDRSRDGSVEVSITVAPDARGGGIGTAMLGNIPTRLGHRPWHRCVAWVKADNVASTVTFLRAGFGFVRRAQHQGSDAYRLELRR